MNLQPIDIYAGANYTLTLYARDPLNDVQTLEDRTIVWRVGKPPKMPDQKGAIFEKDGTVVNAALGSFSVVVMPADTWTLGGNYVHVAITTYDGAIQFVSDADDDVDFESDDGEEIIFVNDDDLNQQVVTTGTLRIRPSNQV